MKRKNTFIVGFIGTILSMLCCATPVLAILLGTVGLGAFTGYLDYILMPSLMLFIGLTIYGYTRHKKSDAPCCKTTKPSDSTKSEIS